MPPVCRRLLVDCCRSTDANSPGEDLHDAAWYQPGLPRFLNVSLHYVVVLIYSL